MEDDKQMKKRTTKAAKRKEPRIVEHVKTDDLPPVPPGDIKLVPGEGLAAYVGETIAENTKIAEGLGASTWPGKSKDLPGEDFSQLKVAAAWPGKKITKWADRVLLRIGGVPVYLDEDGSVHWVGEMTIDADGCPHAYGPPGIKPAPLDYLANAGYPGNWWGIVADGSGRPFVQPRGDSAEDKAKWPWPGYYLSTTAYLVKGFGTYDARRYVDSELVEFAVVPGNVRMAVAPRFLGCKVIITDLKNDKTLECACCDVGPRSHLGEASMAAAQYFGVNSNPKGGGSSERDRWHYRMFPGVPSKDYPLQ